MPPMHMRRSLALVSGALLLSAPLASCGFDNATDRVNTITTGTGNRDASVDVLNAVIVSAEDGSGTLVATFVNNDQDDSATVESIEPAQSTSDDADQVSSVDFSPINVDPEGLVNLAGEDKGIPVKGDFGAGDVVHLTFGISGAQQVELTVPVVPNCGEYAGIDGSGGDCEIGEPVGETH